MNQEHVISDAVMDLVQLAIGRDENWMAYNNSLYFIDKEDVHFFKSESAAREFASDNISDHDHFNIIHVRSIADVLKKIPYGESLEKQLANPDANSLYNTDGNAFTDAMIEHIEQQQILNNKNLSIMNEKNYDYLSNQLKYTGFGEDLQTQLKEKMKNQEPEFMLKLQKDFGKDQTVATLHFRRSDENDMYFFNRYSLMLKNDQHPDPVHHTFFIGNKDANITLKEAYNLMSGRAIHKEVTPKEGEKYNAWLQLDFKETDQNGNFKMKMFHENYGFDLKSVLDKHPIKELKNETDSKRLTESLERGNRQQVTLSAGGRDQKVFIEAVPKFKSLNFYEASGQRIRSDKLYENNTQEQTFKQDKKQSQNQVSEEEGGFDPGKKKTRRKRQNIS